MKKTLPTARIPVVDEQGKRYTIIEETDFMRSPSLDGPDHWIKGLRRFKLDGRWVNYSKEDGTYRCPNTGSVFTPI